jgi:hypothetical protein
MAVVADSVVVRLEADLADANAKVRKYTADFERDMDSVGSSAARSELLVRGASTGVVKSTGQMANASRNLGRQFADVGASLASGSSPFLILAQQAPQVADALADTGGKAAAVASFFAGPWGAALLAAGSVAGVLFGKLLDGGMTVEDLTKKLEENAEKTRLTAEAQQAFEMTAEGAADAVRKLNEEMTKQLQTQDQLLASALRAAAGYRAIAIAAQTARESQLALRVAEAKTANSRSILAGGPGASGLVQVPYIKAQADAERDLARAKAERGAAEKQVALAAIPILDARAAVATDKSAAATDRHTRALGKLRDAYVAASLAAKTNADREEATRRYREGRASIDRRLSSDQTGIASGKSNANAIAKAEATLAGLRRIESQTSGKEQDNVQRRIAAVEKKLGYLRQGIDAGAASVGSGSRGRSAESIARAAEVARIKEVRNNEAYNSELEQLNQGIIDAKRFTETDIRQLAAYARDDVASELKRRLASIDADESAKKYTSEQAETLRVLARKRATLQEENVTSEEIRRRADEENSIAAASLRNQQDVLQAQGNIADTNAERRAIDLKLLDLKYQELRIAQEAIVGDITGRYTAAQREIAQDRLNALPAQQVADTIAVNRQNEGPLAQYRRGLNDPKAQVQAAVADRLQDVDDGITDAITSKLGIKDPLLKQLLDIFIQQNIMKPLYDAFAKTGGGGGGLGGFLGSVVGAVSGELGGGHTLGGSSISNDLFTKLSAGNGIGRASGGFVGAGQMVRVNEGASPGRVEGWQPMGSGKVIPLGQMAAMKSGGTTIIHAPQFNLKGAVVTRELYADMQRISDESAAQAGQAAYKQSLKDAPAAVGRARRYGGS